MGKLGTTSALREQLKRRRSCTSEQNTQEKSGRQRGTRRALLRQGMDTRPQPRRRQGKTNKTNARNDSGTAEHAMRGKDKRTDRTGQGKGKVTLALAQPNAMPLKAREESHRPDPVYESVTWQGSGQGRQKQPRTSAIREKRQRQQGKQGGRQQAKQRHRPQANHV